MSITKSMELIQKLYWEGRQEQQFNIISNSFGLFSFVSSAEVLQVSGIHGVTLPPSILKEMSSTMLPAETPPNYPLNTSRTIKTHDPRLVNDERGFKEALSADKEALRKLQEALTSFLGFEKQLESMMESALRELN